MHAPSVRPDRGPAAPCYFRMSSEEVGLEVMIAMHEEGRYSRKRVLPVGCTGPEPMDRPRPRK